MDWGTIIAIICGTVAPFVLTKFVPNSTFHSWGVYVGEKLSAKGRKIAGKEAWEKLENTFIGSIIAFADGLQEGADKDDL